MMDFACGQDWMKTKMEQMSPQQLIEKLTEASKIDHLKKRLVYIIILCIMFYPCMKFILQQSVFKLLTCVLVLLSLRCSIACPSI